MNILPIRCFFLLLLGLALWTPAWSQTPDGIEDTDFPEGYWAASYYQGRDGTSGSLLWGSETDGTGASGSKIFHGEAFWGIGSNIVSIASNGSASFDRWSNTETPTSPNLHHPSYVGTSWTNINPHYQIDLQRKILANGTLTFGFGANEVVDDVIDVYVNGVRRYAYFPGGGAPDPRPGQGTGLSIAVNAGDDVLVRFINLGFIGGFTFTFTTPADPASLSIEKSSTPFLADSFSIPGNDMLYSIIVTKNGPGNVDTDGIFIVDSLPDSMVFFNGDYNGAEAGADAVGFSNLGAGLSFNTSSDLAYSNAIAAPSNFANCSYIPASGYDPNIRHICINPRGSIPPGASNPSFRIFFRSRIN